MKGQRILRNATALLAGQPITWALTLIFTVIVPRNVGPVEWGEWTVAQSLGQLASVLFDLGINTVLVKGVSRRPEEAESQVGVVLTLRLLLSPLIVLAMLGFSFVAGYSPHTRLLVGLTALSFSVTSVAMTGMYGLQGFERMHVCAFVSVLASVILTSGAVLMVKEFALGVISISVLALGSQLVAAVLQLAWLNRLVRIRPVFNLRLLLQLIRDGLPYWASRGIFIAYAWQAAIMISLLGSTRENGWYGVAFQLMSAPGFLIYAVTTALFPALSRSLVLSSEESVDLMGRSFRLLFNLSLPMAAGLALISGNLVAMLYGAWFAPASPVVIVLTLTIPPVFVATLGGTFLIAADRQWHWTWAMAGLCIANLVLNLFSIRYFHVRHSNGALGAALTLLVTDSASGVLALVLLPRNLLAAVRESARSILAAALATLIMAAMVWPLRDLFLPIPVLVGVVGFVGAALPLRVFPRDELEALTRPVWRLAGRLHPAFASSPVPVLETVIPDSEIG
jgi:O-antigen/teichoic acid export membrane protein